MRGLLTVVCATSIALVAMADRSPDYTIRPVANTDVDVTDSFWAPRIERNRTVSIQHVFDRSEAHGGLAPAQLVEAAAYMLATRRDGALEQHVGQVMARYRAWIDSLVATPAAAVRTPGTLLEAAVAYSETTGDRLALDLAVRAANAMATAYGPGKQTYISGHEGLKIGLISLYRATSDRRYLDLARFFLDERGKDEYPRHGEYAIDRTYAQDHAPVVRQSEAVGHAVRAMYLYIPLADLAALTGRDDYLHAVDRVWEDAVSRKTYVTGGVGSIRFHEQFGAPYELPNLSAWNETCASYGNVVWNHRMFLLHADARYLDQMERILYNAFLAGVSLKGDRFFYQNPLTSYGNYERFDWINTPCCPPNVVRLLASLGTYIYATGPDAVYVNLFVGSTARLRLADAPVTIRQDTQYPWDGRIRITVGPASTRRFSVYVRIPGWTQSVVMPGDLYRFVDERPAPVAISVNGETVTPVNVRGFAKLDREWRPGDTIELSLPMPVRRIAADERVQDDVGRVALQRGPLVYAAEWADNGGHALNILVPDGAPLVSEWRAGLLDGVAVITGPVQAVNRTLGGSIRIEPHAFVAIPYYAWANRGMGEMQVWLPRSPEKARATPILPPDPIVAVRSSGGIPKTWTGYNDQNDDIAAIFDGVDPLSSADESNLYFRMRPPTGQAAWVEYAFKKPVTISASDVYFADNRRFCRLPSSWRLLYRDGDQWKPAHVLGEYPVAKDRFNHVTVRPVTTTAVRLEVEPVTRRYAKGEIGPPEAMFLDKAVEWREFGLIEWRVRVNDLQRGPGAAGPSGPSDDGGREEDRCGRAPCRTAGSVPCSLLVAAVH